MHSTNDLEDGYLGSGKRLRYSIRKYGKENHIREILEFCDSRKELKKLEEEIVTLNEIAKEECMNLVPGGHGGFERTESHKKAMLESFKNRLKVDKSFLEKYKEIGRQNFKNAHKNGKIKYSNFEGKKHSEESKNKISSSMKGKGKGSNNSQFGTCWVTNGTENKKIKKEHIDLWESKGFRKGRII